MSDAAINYTEEEYADTALIATSNVLKEASSITQFARSMYHVGLREIMVARRELFAAEGISMSEKPTEDEIKNALVKLSDESREVIRIKIAKQLVQMRHDLAIRVRKTCGALVDTSSKLIDAVRGKDRAVYEQFINRGLKQKIPVPPEETDVRLIRSASKSSKFVDKLPKGLKWAGRGFILVGVGVSIHIIIDAPPENRDQVVDEQINLWLGMTGGGAAAEIICGVIKLSSTSWVGLLIVFATSIAGGYAAQQIDLARILDLTPFTVPELEGQLFYIEGDWDLIDLLVVGIKLKTVSRQDKIIVLSTGRKSGLMVGGMGHYRQVEVIAASKAADKLFEQYGHKNYICWVNENLLHPVEDKDLLATLEEK